MKKAASLDSLSSRLFPAERFRVLQSLEAALVKSLGSLETQSLHNFLPEKPFITPPLSLQFESYRQEFSRIFTEACQEVSKRTLEIEKLRSELSAFQDMRLRYEIEHSRNELFERSQEISQKESENMRFRLIELANRLDKEAEVLSQRKRDLDQEVEIHAREKIEELQSVFMEKERRLLETITITDEKAEKQEEFARTLEKKLNDLIAKRDADRLEAVLQEENRKALSSLERRLSVSEKAGSELAQKYEDSIKAITRLEKERAEVQKTLEISEAERKKLTSEKKALSEKLFEVSESLDQKAQFIETWQAENHAKFIELTHEFEIEREELLARIRRYEKNEVLMRKAPSQSQGFSPLPKDFEVKFENFNDFRLEALTLTPKNRLSTHTKPNDRSFSIDFRKNENLEASLAGDRRRTQGLESNNTLNIVASNGLAIENKALKEEVKRLMEETGFLKKSLESLREAKAEIQRQFEKVLKDANKIREENGLKDRRVLQVLKELEVLKSLKVERQGLAARVEELERENAKGKETISEMAEEKRRKIEDLTAGLNREKELAIAELTGKARTYEAQVQEKELRNAELLREVEGLKRSVGELSGKLAEKAGKLRVSEEELARLQERLRELGTQIECLRKNSDLKRLKEFYEQVLKDKEASLSGERERVLEAVGRLKEKDLQINELMGKIADFEAKIREKEWVLAEKSREIEGGKEKLAIEEKLRVSALALQKEVAEKGKEILKKNAEIAALSQKVKQLSAELSEERRKAFSRNPNSGAIFIDDPNVKDLEIAGLKQSLRQKQVEIDRMKEKLEKCLLNHYNVNLNPAKPIKERPSIKLVPCEVAVNNTANYNSAPSNPVDPAPQAKSPNTSQQPLLLLKAIEKKDQEIKLLNQKNADLYLNLQSAVSKLAEHQKSMNGSQAGIPRGKSDGVVFDRTFQRLLSENERMKTEISRLEQLLMKSRLDSVEGRTCLQNEMKLLEEKNVEFKIKLAQTAFDKDYYMIKYQGLVKDMERTSKK